MADKNKPFKPSPEGLQLERWQARIDSRLRRLEAVLGILDPATRNETKELDSNHDDSKRAG